MHHDFDTLYIILIICKMGKITVGEQLFVKLLFREYLQPYRFFEVEFGKEP